VSYLKETAIIQYECPNCKSFSLPNGQYLTTLPYVGYVKCPYCSYEDYEAIWTDSNIHSEMIRKKYRLNQNEDSEKLINRISRLEEKSSKLENENRIFRQTLNIERHARDLLEKEIAESRAFRERYERDLVTLESLIELKTIKKTDEDKFQEANK